MFGLRERKYRRNILIQNSLAFFFNSLQKSKQKEQVFWKFCDMEHYIFPGCKNKWVDTGYSSVIFTIVLILCEDYFLKISLHIGIAFILFGQHSNYIYIFATK